MNLEERVFKLLLLEDTPEDAELILHLLDRANITIVSRVVSSKQGFMKELSGFRPDFIISDHQLPQFTSNEALSISRAVYPFIPFILVTGTVSEEFAASIIKAGADDYLLKNNLNRLGTAVLQAIDKKKTEERLKSAHDRLVFHINNTPLGFIEWDSNFMIKSWSNRATQIFGWTEEEIISSNTSGIGYVYRDDRAAVAAVAEDLRHGRKANAQLLARSYTKSGSLIWCEWFTSVLTDNAGKVITLMSLVQDITQRKKTEDDLDLVISRFKQAQKIAHLGHWETNFKEQRSTWSPETYRILGLEPDSVEPSEQLLMSYVHPADAERVKWCMEEAKTTLRPFSLYHRIVPENGGLCTVYAAGHSEFDELGNASGLYGVMLDVTELTEKENKLEQVNRELETFIYKTYHDLRSPIVSILGIVNIARKEIKDEKALNYFSIIDEVTLKQNKMLLNLVKVMAIRDRQLITEPVEIKSLVRETINGLESTLDFSKVTFTIDDTSGREVMTDRELLFNMLFQLIENSILYRNPNSSDSQVHIRISGNDPEQVVIEITDNGIGMPSGIINKVFDMFYRGTNLSKGSGLGLYLVKNAIEKLKGTISLSSYENKGSTFVLRFPVKPVQET